MIDSVPADPVPAAGQGQAAGGRGPGAGRYMHGARGKAVGRVGPGDARRGQAPGGAEPVIETIKLPTGHQAGYDDVSRRIRDITDMVPV